MPHKDPEARRAYMERYRQKRLGEAGTLLCACGCGEIIPAIGSNGRPRTYVPGHHKKRSSPPPRVMNAPLIPCACGCGETLPAYNKHGNKQSYIYGHATGQLYGNDEPPESRQALSQNPSAIYSRKRKWARKMAVLRAYGGGTPVCACCGESNPVFLAIDHVKGKGNEHRRKLGSKGGATFYNWLIRERFPPGYRVLCHNCNMAIGILGYCPHNP